MTSEEYKRLLKRPEWLAKAKAIRRRDHYRCVMDSKHRGALHVHHVSYDPENLRPWEYPDYMLMTLCSDCHKQRHAIEKKIRNSILVAMAKVPNDRLERVALRLMAEAMETL